MNIVKHLTASPFVAATGVAALVHSTWTLATLFGGTPADINNPADFIRWLAWVLPAAMIAFALDVGQINTSLQIAQAHDERRRPWIKYVTFFVFAGATYYLQWFHLVHHLPVLDLSAGIEATATIITLKVAAIWIIPGLLPLSTLLYTFSHSSARKEQPPPFVSTATSPPSVKLSAPDALALAANTDAAPTAAATTKAKGRTRATVQPPVAPLPISNGHKPTES